MWNSKNLSMEALLGDKTESELESAGVVAGWQKIHKCKYFENSIDISYRKSLWITLT